MIILDTIVKAAKVVWEVLKNAPWLWFAIFFVVQRYIPGADKFFRAVYVTVDEIDRITDAILEEFPKLDHVQTVSDISDEVKKILSKKYGKIDESKIDKMIKNKLSKEDGISLNWDGDKKFIEFNKRF